MISDRVLLLLILLAVVLYRLVVGLAAHHRAELARIEGLLQKSEAERRALLEHMAQSPLFGEKTEAPVKHAAAPAPQQAEENEPDEEETLQALENAQLQMARDARPHALPRLIKRIHREREQRQLQHRMRAQKETGNVLSMKEEFEKAAQDVEQRRG